MTDVATSSETMVRQMCLAADAGDGQRFASFFSPDATFRFGNRDVLVGRPAIAASTEGTVDAIWPMRHRVEQVAEIGNRTVLRFTISGHFPRICSSSICLAHMIGLATGSSPTTASTSDISPALRASSTL